MPTLNLLAIADSEAFLAPLKGLDAGIRLVSDPAEAEIVLYAGTNPAALHAALPLATQARWIHSLWTGVEGILGRELQQHPAPLTNGRGVFRWPLADWTAAAMLHFAFDLGRVIRQQQRGVWQHVIGTSLEGRTLGIVGYGAIGSAAAMRARAFGMMIAALRRRPELFADDKNVDRIFAPEDLKKMMSVSDYVLVATPLTAETRGLVGQHEIAAMKPSGVLINVGRGPVIDEAALIDALQSGKLRGAALDVFTVEPLPNGHPFWAMPNVLLSPHTADRVEGFLGPAFECFIENLKRFQSGAPLAHIVDKHAGY